MNSYFCAVDNVYKSAVREHFAHNSLLCGVVLYRVAQYESASPNSSNKLYFRRVLNSLVRRGFSRRFRICPYFLLSS